MSSFRAFPSYDAPDAEAAFREWMSELTGLVDDELEEWLIKQTVSMLDEVGASRAWNMRQQISRVAVVELTERQVQILRLAACGYSLEEIGRQLFVSRETVKAHLRWARTKTGTKSMTQLVVYALATGQL